MVRESLMPNSRVSVLSSDTCQELYILAFVVHHSLFFFLYVCMSYSWCAFDMIGSRCMEDLLHRVSGVRFPLPAPDLKLDSRGYSGRPWSP